MKNKINILETPMFVKWESYAYHDGKLYNIEYYISLKEVLFFETEENNVFAHTLENVYKVKYKLYELEKLLPGNFMRVSKSSILNIDYIYSITRNITASSIVEFQNTYKKVYVSRNYYKPLKFKLLEKRR